MGVFKNYDVNQYQMPKEGFRCKGEMPEDTLAFFCFVLPAYYNVFALFTENIGIPSSRQKRFVPS